jgi:hypothetical protein
MQLTCIPLPCPPAPPPLPYPTAQPPALPPAQSGAKLHYVSDLFLLGWATIYESLSLLGWLQAQVSTCARMRLRPVHKHYYLALHSLSRYGAPTPQTHAKQRTCACSACSQHPHTQSC